MADLPDNPISSHGKAGSTMEVADHGKDLEMPDEIHILVEEFEAESLEMGMKIHRLPPSLADMGDQFVTPMAVAIGPYHHGLRHLEGMEKAKRVAAYTLTRDSGKSREEMYSLVLEVADKGRRMYADDVVSGISTTEFADMMFHDACFLLQYMLSFPFSLSRETDSISMSPLQRFFFTNMTCINIDIMLLQNQLPWFVIEALRAAMRVDVGSFIAWMRNSMSPYEDYHGYALSSRAPHLLGHLLLHKQGASVVKVRAGLFCALSAPVSAMELEGIGIKLVHSKTGHIDIGIKKGFLFDKLHLPSLQLDRIRASWIANLVALEVCTASYSSESNSSVCSYVAILAMLMDREEDVHKLRSKGFIHGELSDKQILDFFNGLAQQISPGIHYFHILHHINDCKHRRFMRIMVCKFVSNNAKAIAATLSIIGVLVGIFKALYSLKQH